MRYYSKGRMITAKTLPTDIVPMKIENFPDEEFFDDIEGMAFGYVDFDDPLTEEQECQYELTPAPQQSWFCVVSTFHDDGRVTCNMTAVVLTDKQPESSSFSKRDKDVYIDYFSSKRKAMKHIEETRRA